MMHLSMMNVSIMHVSMVRVSIVYNMHVSMILGVGCSQTKLICMLYLIVYHSTQRSDRWIKELKKSYNLRKFKCLKASREKLGGSFNFNSGGTRRVAEATSKSIKCEWGGCLFTVLVTDDASLIHLGGCFCLKVNSGGTDRSSKDRRGLRPPDRQGPDGAGQEGEDGDGEEAP